MLFAGAGGLLSLFLVSRTLVGFRRLSWPARFAGVLPALMAAWIGLQVWAAL